MKHQWSPWIVTAAVLFSASPSWAHRPGQGQVAKSTAGPGRLARVAKPLSWLTPGRVAAVAAYAAAATAQKASSPVNLRAGAAAVGLGTVAYYQLRGERRAWMRDKGNALLRNLTRASLSANKPSPTRAEREMARKVLPEFKRLEARAKAAHKKAQAASRAAEQQFDARRQQRQQLKVSWSSPGTWIRVPLAQHRENVARARVERAKSTTQQRFKEAARADSARVALESLASPLD